MWKPTATPGNSKAAEQIVEQLYRYQESTRLPTRIPQRCAQALSRGRSPLRVKIPPCEPTPRPVSEGHLEDDPNQLKSDTHSVNSEKKKIWIPASKVHPQPLTETRTTAGDRNKVHPQPQPVIEIRTTTTGERNKKPTPPPTQGSQGKKTPTELSMKSNKKSTKPVTVAPVTKKQTPKGMANGKPPDHVENSKKNEGKVTINDYAEETHNKEMVSDLKLDWEEKMAEYEKTRSELQEKQTTIMQQYADLQIVHDRMKIQNDNVKLPPSEDLKVLNIANLSPEQLLKLCAATEEYFPSNEFVDVPIDVKQLYSLAGNLMTTCQDTLAKRQEIIDWLDSLLKTYPEKKGIKMKTLASKINEISKENNTLQTLLEERKSEFLREVDEITDSLRKGINHTMGLQLKNEELTYELSELNAQNADLRKKLHAAESRKAHGNKIKIEEIERLLQEEKYKNGILTDRVTRSEAQVKMGTKRTEQLEAALKKAQEQVWALDRTAQELRMQNEKIQSDFDKELNTFTVAIQDNTSQIQKIAEAREKLQADKENLERRLEELTCQNDIAIERIVKELNSTQMNLTETEKKYKEEVDEKKRLEFKMESLHKKLMESEIQCKEIFKELQEKDEVICKALALQTELSSIKTQLDQAKSETENYKKKLLYESEAIKEVERSLEENLKAEEFLKSELKNREEYIMELERHQSLLKQELLNSEAKTNSYEHQLSSLEEHIVKLGEDFGGLENLNELSDMVHKQQSKLEEVILRNAQLAEEIQKKDEDLKKYEDVFEQQERKLKQKDEDIHMLFKKDDEQTNIIKSLQKDLEIRTHQENLLNEKLNEKAAEIESQKTDLENGRQQISHLEEIVRTLEDQTQQASFQRNIDLEEISTLEANISALKAKTAEYEAYFIEVEQDADMPAENVDTLINILEDEIRLPLDPIKPSLSKNSDVTESIKRQIDDLSKNSKTSHKSLGRSSSIYQEVKCPSRHQRDQENIPTKLSGENNSCNNTTMALKNVEPSERELCPRNRDLKRRSYAASSFHGCGSLPLSPSVAKKAVPTVKSNDETTFLEPNRFRTERQSKMLKLACHRIND